MIKSACSLILQVHQSTGIPWHVIERDYLLSWILAGISQVPALFDTLVFKGGKALRKCYFDDYRFSEELGFFRTPWGPKGRGHGPAKELCNSRWMMQEDLPGNIMSW